MDLASFEWLLTPAGQQLLTEAAHVYADASGDPVRAAQGVRRTEADPARAAAALTTVQLRVRAVPKFGEDAVRMYFTPDALEQATRASVARHRASRLAAARPASVIDLGCSIGGDLVAMARAGLTVAGVDLDPVRVAMARANLEALGLSGAVQVADATAVDTSPFAATFLDPARRTGAGRTFDTADWTPPWRFVLEQLRHDAVVKLAPGLPHDVIPDGVEAEWVSDAGDVKEAVLWSGHLATVRRRATVIPSKGSGPAPSGGLASLTEDDDPYDGRERPVRELGRFLYEPDGAVIRAGLVTAVAAGVDGGLLDEHIAYVTSDAAFHSPFARTYEVLEVLPYREKLLKMALKERGIGTLTIKKRGVDVVPDQLRRRLALRGPETATLVLTRVRGAGTALLVRPF
jgi:predicted RNA methylase